MRKNQISVFFLFWIAISIANAQIRFSGNNHLEYSHNESKDVTQYGSQRNDFLENWTEGYLSYKNWRAGIRLGIHNPPHIFSPDQSIQKLSLERRFLEYDSGNLNIVAGHFYSLFGRGLVLRFFENRQLRYDTRIDGLKINYIHPRFSVKLVSGEPINRVNERHDLFHAGEVKINPFRTFFVGGTFLTTHPTEKQRVNWASFLSEFNFDYGSIYFEYAQEDNPNALMQGKAIYLNTNIFLGAFSLLAEYKDYDQFEQYEGAYFNNPPLVAREHLFSLLNRHQLVQNADDEQGMLFEAGYPVIEDGILTLHYSRTENDARLKRHEEYYSQFDWTTPFDWEVLFGFGKQKDPSARYLNFVNSTSFGLSDAFSLKSIFEHQHTKRLLNLQQFYSQAITIGLSHLSGWTVSFLGERTTEQQSPKNYWGAVQFNLNLSQKLELSFIAGSRRKGKYCVGGVCVIKPELEGIEATLITRF